MLIPEAIISAGEIRRPNLVLCPGVGCSLSEIRYETRSLLMSFTCERIARLDEAEML